MPKECITNSLPGSCCSNSPYGIFKTHSRMWGYTYWMTWLFKYESWGRYNTHHSQCAFVWFLLVLQAGFYRPVSFYKSKSPLQRPKPVRTLTRRISVFLPLMICQSYITFKARLARHLPTTAFPRPISRGRADWDIKTKAQRHTRTCGELVQSVFILWWAVYGQGCPVERILSNPS